MTGNDIIVSKDAKGPDNGPAPAAVKPPIHADAKKKKKKSGAFGFFSAALFMLRKRSGGKAAEKTLNKQKSAESNANWKKLVGSMRPLSLEETTMPPSPPPPQKQAPAVESKEIVIPPASPAASSSCGTMSQYASATNLHDLDDGSDDEEDPDEVFDALCGDEMIDAKAEEFIAQFYRQIQIQNTSATDRHA